MLPGVMNGDQCQNSTTGTSQTVFRDEFSGSAHAYARGRPGYPDRLFAILADLAPSREYAWDCGTGSGQAAIGLANYFSNVQATDASAEQIAEAISHERVCFRVAMAETSGLPDESCDVISIAQALHWFDLPTFYAEARRVLKPDGVIAAYGYTEFYISDSIDPIVYEYLLAPLVGFCPSENSLLWAGYQMEDFPFEELPRPGFLAMHVRWSLAQLLDYALSWSGTQRRIQQLGDSHLAIARTQLQEVWGDPDEARPVVLPLTLRLARRPTARGEGTPSTTP